MAVDILRAVKRCSGLGLVPVSTGMRLGKVRGVAHVMSRHSQTVEYMP